MSSRAKDKDKSRRELMNQLLVARGELLDAINQQQNSGMIKQRTNNHHKASDKIKLPSISKELESLTIAAPSNMMLAYPHNHFNSKTKRVVKLPIFRLPAPAMMAASSIREVKRIQSAEREKEREIRHDYVAYRDKRGLRKALITLIKDLHAREKLTLNSTLHLSATDIDDCMSNMKEHFVELASKSTHKQMVLDIFPIDESMTIFLTALLRLAIPMEDNGVAVGGVASGNTLGNTHTFHNDPIRAISRGVDFRSIGLSSDFKDFLTTEKMSSSTPIRLANDAWSIVARPDSSSMKASQNDPYNHNNSLTSLSKSQSMISSPSSRLPPLHAEIALPAKKKRHANKAGPTTTTQHVSTDIVASSDPKVLTKQFLSSIMSVQKHTALVKKALESAQSMVSIEDSRAKELIFMLGAERMQRALYKLVLLERRRGFIGWQLYVHQQRRIIRTQRFLRVLIIRNILTVLHNTVRRLLKVTIDKWVDFKTRETVRLRDVRRHRATVLIQSSMRRFLSRKKVKLIKQRRKYERLYDSTVKIQTLFRGKLARWKYIKRITEIKQRKASLLIQRCYRGYCGRKRVFALRMRRNRNAAATAIQKIIRGRQARVKVRRLRRQRQLNKAATKIQALIRGFIARRTISKKLIEKARYKYAVKIQARVRGTLSRMNRSKRIREIQAYKYMRNKAATMIQALYRGYRARIMVRIMMMQLKKKRAEQFKAATHITRIVRGFLSRRYLIQLKSERFQKWLDQARAWQETWNDEYQCWAYINSLTGEYLWEPTRDGYTRNDNRLVLASGEIIDDPRFVVKDDDESSLGIGGKDEETEAEKKRKRNATKLCAECGDRIAVRKCNECTDQFCTKCYKATHALGARRHHTFVELGPKDCDECELLLAERFCVSCDENFCDGCWRRLHSHGKRCYHPYSEISPEGRVDSRIFTMDGDEMKGGYDATYAQQRMDGKNLSTQAAAVTQQLAGYQTDEYQEQQQALEYGDNGSGYYDEQQQQQMVVAGGDGYGEAPQEWTEYQDDAGFTYYYNNYTYESTYDYPYAT